MYANLVLFVKGLLYDNAWSSCDWWLIGWGKETWVAQSPLSSPWLRGLDSTWEGGHAVLQCLSLTEGVETVCVTRCSNKCTALSSCYYQRSWGSY